MLRHVSIFSQVIDLVDRNVFNSLLRDYRRDRYSNCFLTRDQFVSTLFRKLAKGKNFREMSGVLY